AAVVRRMDAFSLLKQAPDRVYHFIYVAPPQYKGLWLRTLQALEANPAWITEDTYVIVQIDPSEREDVSFKHLTLVDERRYGKTLLWFFVNNASLTEE